MAWTRREVMKAGAGVMLAAWGASKSAFGQATQPIGKGKRILFFTKSQGYAHAVVTRAAGEPLALAERLLKEWGEKAGYGVEVSKDGSLFTPEYVARFDAFVFYTLGDLTKPPGLPTSDKTPAMTAEGKAALLAAIEAGKGFVGLHSATDTFQDLTRKGDPVAVAKAGTTIDPFCEMVGAEFTSHAKQQQAATIRVAAHDFPGLENLQDFTITEEWYAFTNLAPDLHVILVQDTATMKVDPKTGERDVQYRGSPYPETWARMEGKGRVFYTSMGHREDVWNSDRYQQIVMAGIAWACGLTGTEVKGNLAEACPQLMKA